MSNFKLQTFRTKGLIKRLREAEDYARYYGANTIKLVDDYQFDVEALGLGKRVIIKPLNNGKMVLVTSVHGNGHMQFSTLYVLYPYSR